VPTSQASALFDIVGAGAPVGLALVDTELRFVRVNAALAAINGRPIEEHIGRRIDEVLPEFADALVPVYREVLETGEAILEREIVREVRESSHVRHVLASWFPVRMDGAIVGVGAVVVDITDRKEAELRLQGVLQQLPVGVVIADAGGEIVLGNRQLDEMGLVTGDLSDQRVGQSSFVGWRPDGSQYAPEDLPLSRALRTGAVIRGEEITFMRADGARRTIEANSAPILDGEEVVAAVAVMQDITERHLAFERQELLVRAGEVLDSALGVDERLERFAQLLVPQVADHVKIELLEGSGGRRPVAVARRSAETTEDPNPRGQIVVPLRARGRVLGALSLTMAESGRRYAEGDLDLASDLGLRAGLAVENARLYEDAQASAAAEQRRAAQLVALADASLAIHRTRLPERRLQLIAQSARELLDARRGVVTVRVGLVSEAAATSEAPDVVPEADEAVAAAPLIARDGSEFGRIEVVGKPGGFTPGDDLALEDLARLASLALENVRLEERERQVARTLQASLLPPRLPEIEGLEVGARYLAGGEGTLVGGDVYDLFPVADEWAFMVGDVCGKGAEAAALTAMVRYTLRAEAAHHARPRDVLALVNGAILRQFQDGRFCTVLHGRVRVEEGTARFRLAAGGHPPPILLRADGTVEPVTVGGPLLGVLPTVSHPDVLVSLAPGDALVCFTDGVTEGRGAEGMFGDHGLPESIAAAAGLEPDAIAAHLVRAALDFQGGQTQDDVAVLVLRVPPEPRIA
jgi:PAS domain S-box-containing protein